MAFTLCYLLKKQRETWSLNLNLSAKCTYYYNYCARKHWAMDPRLRSKLFATTSNNSTEVRELYSFIFLYEMNLFSLVCLRLRLRTRWSNYLWYKVASQYFTVIFRTRRKPCISRWLSCDNRTFVSTGGEKKNKTMSDNKVWKLNDFVKVVWKDAGYKPTNIVMYANCYFLRNYLDKMFYSYDAASESTQGWAINVKHCHPMLNFQAPKFVTK